LAARRHIILKEGLTAAAAPLPAHGWRGIGPREIMRKFDAAWHICR
jgi:hypothetical protein